MILMKRLAGGAAMGVLALAMSSAVYAQETTGGIRGVVTNGAGAPVAGAAVTIVHEPTGTRSTTVTGADGAYTVRGLRVGGPYTVNVSSAGESGEVVIDNVAIGGATTGDITLSATVAEVVISGTRSATANFSNATRFGAQQIEEAPSINRDLKDTVRFDPLVSYDPANQKALIIGGVSNRFNSITVDGVKQNDDFGLNNNGYPTQRSPISIDAVEAVAVNTAPFSVVYNDFLGANLNAVTKSGTNELHGGAFVEYSRYNKFPGFSKGKYLERTWGVHLGGPIWKDHLFIFGSYEKYDSSQPYPSGVPGSGRPTMIDETSAAQVTTIEDTLATVYKFDYDKTNSILNASDLAVVDEKKNVRLDWNITDRHRATVTWQDTYGERQIEGIRASNTVTRLLPLRSHYYKLSDALEVYTAQLNSDWTDYLSTELTYNWKNVVRGQVPIAGCATGPSGAGDETCEFGQFTVFLTPNTTINAGPDTSRHANELETTTEGWSGRVRYESEGHSLLFGVEYETLDVFNLFAGSTEGVYTFRASTAGTNVSGALFGTATGLENLQRQRAERLQYTNALVDVNGDGVKNELDAAAEFRYSTTSAYLEDEFQVTDKLSLLLGVRFESLGSAEKPLVNQYFVQRYGFGNDANLNGREIILPRVGFRYEYDDTLSFAGGVGLFSTGGPTVWVSNNYSTNGVILASVDCNLNSATGSTATCSRAQAEAVLNTGSLSGFDVPAAAEALLNPSNPAFATVQRAATVNALDPNFKIPSSWKLSLSAKKFWNDWRFGLDLLHTRVNDGLLWVDYRGGLTPVAFAPDGRPIYRNQAQRGAFIGAAGTDSGSDIILTNTNKGWATSVALSAQRSWDNGIDFAISHTENRAKDVNPGTNTTASSTYGNNAVSDPVNPGLARSNYEIRYSTKFAFNVTKTLWDDNKSTFTLFGERRAGLPYSIVFRPVTATGSTTNAALDYFGDISSARQLAYIPLAGVDPIVTYVGNAQQILDAYIADAGLEAFRGKIIPRNVLRSADVTKFDIRISQELPAFFPNGAKARLYLDIENVGNLISKDWGVLEQVEFPYMAPIADVRLVNGKYEYSNARRPVTQTSNSDAPNRSFWGVKVGLSYKF